MFNLWVVFNNYFAILTQRMRTEDENIWEHLKN